MLSLPVHRLLVAVILAFDNRAQLVIEHLVLLEPGPDEHEAVFAIADVDPLEEGVSNEISKQMTNDLIEMCLYAAC